ncbi:MAG: LL-diaminopimelate aminotransferase [Bacillota bacterium]
MRFAERIAQVPPYLFAELNKKKAALTAQGADLIDLGVGDPDRPTPIHVIEALARAAQDPATHRYPPYEGILEFRSAMARYYQRRFGVNLDPEREVMTVIGSKEGLAHLLWGLVGPGDVALVPEPAYPVYRTHTLLAGAEPYPLPLAADNGFLPDLEAVPAAVLDRARVLLLNYPNNPTTGVVDLGFFEHVVDFAHRHGLVVCHDAAYVELTFDGYRAPSILQVTGAREVAVEFYSLSKPFNMTGWRLGAALGNQDVVFRALGIIKTNTDSGQFAAVQLAGVAALEHDPADFITGMNQVYAARRQVLVEGLRQAGFDVKAPLGTFYVWAPAPPGEDAAGLAARLLEQAHVIAVPGAAYGKAGRDYLRFACTVEEDRLREATQRIRAALG